MLSYRHEFHAGNVGDLLKHATLALILEYLKQKPAPIRYIDTHAGAGMYAIDGERARKTGEFALGVGSVNLQTLPAMLQSYGAVQREFLARRLYAGSPMLASHLLREQDELRLFELHSSEFPRLQAAFARDRRTRVFNDNGFEAVTSLLPVQNARAVVLIDPSYENRSDYEGVVTCVQKGYSRMPNAVFAIWYPVVGNPALPVMLRKLTAIATGKVWQFALTAADVGATGMTATGMIVINPPWTLPEELTAAFALLCPQLAFTESNFTASCLKD